jgi:hypothetical protein
MTQEQIKIECEKAYAQITSAENRLKEIRSLCKHPNTFEGNYQWRIGSIIKGEICSDCNTFIKRKEE